MVEQKKKLAMEKREKVLERKFTLGELGSSMMQLVGDKDNIWDLIVKEESFKDQTPAQLMKTDLISFEK